MPIPHIKVTFPAPAEVIRSEVTQESCEEELDLACLIRLCLEEFLVNAIISLGDDLTSTIRPYEPGEIVGHRTTKPALWLHRLSKEYSIIVWLGPSIARKSWNNISSLLCMLISCFLHSLFAFPSLFSKKKKCFFFTFIRHELSYGVGRKWWNELLGCLAALLGPLGNVDQVNADLVKPYVCERERERERERENLSFLPFQNAETCSGNISIETTIDRAKQVSRSMNSLWMEIWG